MQDAKKTESSDNIGTMVRSLAAEVAAEEEKKAGVNREREGGFFAKGNPTSVGSSDIEAMVRNLMAESKKEEQKAGVNGNGKKSLSQCELKIVEIGSNGTVKNASEGTGWNISFE